MASVNKIIVLGRLGRDPEVRYLPSGDAVANVTMATGNKYKNKAGELIEETEWHRVTFFGRLAEIAGQYLKKGALAYVEGRIKTNKYTDKDGIERFSTDIIASTLQLLGGKEEETEDAPKTKQASLLSGAPTGKPIFPEKQSKPVKPASTSGSGFDDMDDDIPF